MQADSIKQLVVTAHQCQAPKTPHLVRHEVNIWETWCRMYAVYTRLCSIEQTPEFADQFAQYIAIIWLPELSDLSDISFSYRFDSYYPFCRIFGKTQATHTDELCEAETNPHTFIRAIYAWYETITSKQRHGPNRPNFSLISFPAFNLYRLHGSIFYLSQYYSRNSPYAEGSYRVQSLISQLHVGLNLIDYTHHIREQSIDFILYVGHSVTLKVEQTGGYAAAVKAHDPQQLRRLRSVILFPYYVQLKGVAQADEIMGTQDSRQTHYLSCANVEDAITWIQTEHAANRLKPFIYRKQQSLDVFSLTNLHPYSPSNDCDSLAHRNSNVLLQKTAKRRLRVRQDARYTRWV